MLKREPKRSFGGGRSHNRATSAVRSSGDSKPKILSPTEGIVSQPNSDSSESIFDSLTSKLLKNDRFANHLFYHPRKVVFDEIDALCRDLGGDVPLDYPDFRSVLRIREAGARLRVMLRKVAAILSSDSSYDVRNDCTYEAGLLPVLADCAIVATRTLSNNQISTLRSSVASSGVRGLADPLAQLLQKSNISIVKLSTCIMLLGQLSKQLPNYFEVLQRCVADIRRESSTPTQVYFSALVLGDAIAGADGMRLAGTTLGPLDQFVARDNACVLRQTRAEYVKSVTRGLATLLGFTQLEDLLEMFSTLSEFSKSQQSTTSLSEDASWYNDIMSSIN